MNKKELFETKDVTDLMVTILNKYNEYTTYTERKDFLEDVGMVIEKLENLSKEMCLIDELNEELEKEDVSNSKLGKSEVILDRGLTVGELIKELEKEDKNKRVAIIGQQKATILSKKQINKGVLHYKIGEEPDANETILVLGK